MVIAVQSLNPIYLTAGGTLFGVLLTLLSQVLLAFIQRRHDKQQDLGQGLSWSE